MQHYDKRISTLRSPTSTLPSLKAYCLAFSKLARHQDFLQITTVADISNAYALCDHMFADSSLDAAWVEHHSDALANG